jgi:hypothetical protein
MIGSVVPEKEARTDYFPAVEVDHLEDAEQSDEGDQEIEGGPNSKRSPDIKRANSDPTSLSDIPHEECGDQEAT